MNVTCFLGCRKKKGGQCHMKGVSTKEKINTGAAYSQHDFGRKKVFGCLADRRIAACTLHDIGSKKFWAVGSLYPTRLRQRFWAVLQMIRSFYDTTEGLICQREEMKIKMLRSHKHSH